MRKVDDNDLPIFDLTLLPLEEGTGKEADGFDKIAFVDNPAIEEMGVYLSNQKVVADEKTQVEILKYLENCGVSKKDVEHILIEKTEEEYLQIASKTSILHQLTTDPTARQSKNDITTEEGKWLVRYEYQGPEDSKNRKFCASVLRLDRIYTEEEIKNGLSNPEFGNYSIYDFKGSYGCRHRWRRRVYFIDKDDVNSRPAEAFLTPAVVRSRLNDSKATTYNSNLSSHFKLENNEKQQVVAPLLIPNKKIFREDKNGEYFIRFSSEAIAQIRDKAEKDGKLKNLNIMKDTHDGDIVKAFIIDEWIIEDENDKAYTEYGFDREKITIGSWMVITQIIDPEYWANEIKKNKKFSYSIEAFLNMKLVNLKINKKETMENEEKITFEIDGKTYQLIDGKPVLVDEKKDEEVKAEDKTEDKDEEKVDVDVEAESKDEKETEENLEKDEEKTDEEVKAEDKTEDKDEEKVDVDVEAEEDKETVSDENTSENEEDTQEDKFEALYEEIAELKTMISEIQSKDTVDKVEMNAQKKSMVSSVSALQKLYKKNKFK